MPKRDVTVNIEVHAIAGGHQVEVSLDDPNEPAQVANKREPVKFDRQALLGEQGDPAAYGSMLAEQLLPRGLREHFVRSEVSAKDAESLRVVLHFSEDMDEQILGLRWELLRHPETGVELAMSERIVLSRFLATSDWRSFQRKPRGDLRALVAIAAPTNVEQYKLAPVDYDGEAKRASKALEAMATVDVIGGPDDPCTMTRLFDALPKDVDILYLVCHGSIDRQGTESALLLQSETGEVARVSGQKLAEQFRARARPIPLVVLASCKSASAYGEHIHASFASALARAGVAAIVAMQGNITMETIEEMMPTFFEQLALHGRVDRAMAVARARVHRLGRTDAWMPTLYTRLKDGRLWTVDDAEATSGEAGTFAAELELYKGQIRDKYERLPLLGFDFKSARGMRAKFDELVVSLHASVDRKTRGADLFSEAQLEEEAGSRLERLTLADAIRYAEKQRLRGLVLLGDPGTGKTTFLQQVLLLALASPEGLGLPRDTIPVFLPLRELRDEHLDLGGFIHSQLPVQEGYDPSFGRRLVDRGKLLLLFDGLDELADIDQRKRVKSWIENQLVAVKHSYVVVSCRYAGYQRQVELDMHAFVEFKLRPLSDEQMQTLVRNWYQLAEDNDLLAAGESGAARAAKLLKLLTSPEFGSAQLHEMTRNPLLLTGMCWVHWEKDELSHARAELFEQCIAVLGKRWKQRSEQDDGTYPFGREEWSEEQLEEVLRPVGAWMHAEHKRRAKTRELVKPTSEALEHHDVPMKAEAFLRGVRDEAGLLSGIGRDELEFVHLGFQEFLTARHYQSERNYERLVEHFGDSWWREVTLLTLGEEGAFEPFMRALTEHEKFGEWSESDWMQRCLTEAKSPTAAPFEAVLREGKGEHALAAAKLAAGLKSADELDALLREHPDAGVRQWWEDRRRAASRVTKTVHGVELVEIPAGRFRMGSSWWRRRFGRAHRDEGPRRKVELASFFLARTPVTNEQYGRYLEANPQVEKPGYWADSNYNQPSQPVVGVSWRDAQEYCEWAGLVLPTEAQWEYACRAGTDTYYWSGDDEESLGRVGWYDGNSDRRLHPVAQKEPNAFGLYDVHGNVWEWCLDGASPLESYTTSPRAGDGSRREPAGDRYRVLRGGCWDFVAVFARSAFRYCLAADVRYSFIGFRPAQGIP